MAAVERRGGRGGVRAAMFARILFRSLTVRSGPALTAMLSVMVGAAVVSALLCLYFDISIKMSEELRSFGANFYVGAAPQAGNSRAERGFGRDSYDAMLAAVPGDRLRGASPFLYGLVRLDLGDAVLTGVDFTGLRQVSPYWQVEGAWISQDFDERNAMVGRRLAESMELKPGDSVTVVSRDRSRRTSVTVKGILDAGDSSDTQMFVNLSLAQRLFAAPGRVDAAMLSIRADGAEADALAAELNGRFSGIDARPIRKMSRVDGQILDRIEGLMALVAALILVITTLCVNATLTAMVAKRTPEIGLQKALGATNGAVAAQFLLETAGICLAGVAGGLLLGAGLAQILGQAVFNGWVTLRPLVIPLTAGVSLAAALAAASIPIRNAVRVVPARVLRGD
ncbi:ABC transporter permease [Azospirillum doebereinerae]